MEVLHHLQFHFWIWRLINGPHEYGDARTQQPRTKHMVIVFVVVCLFVVVFSGVKLPNFRNYNSN